MAIIQWNNSLSVGISEIDTQHQRLVKLINDLNEAMKVGQGKTVLTKIIQDLTTYASTHFTTEEKYFATYDYPEAASHKDEHLAFVQKVMAFKKDFIGGQIGLTIPVMNFLSDWLKNHIMGSDKKYAPFLKEKGLK